MKRVAHAPLRPGADPVAVLAACRQAAVDLIELDVMGPPVSDDLVVAHDVAEARSGAALPLADAVALVEAAHPRSFYYNIDLKLTGYEDWVVEVLRAAGVLERSLLSTMEESSLRHLRAAAPAVRLGWSVPRVRRDPFRSVVTAVPAYAVVQVLRRRLPRVVGRAIRERRVDAIMANHHVVTPALVSAVTRAGGELYVWTVDDADHVARLRDMGVSGCISNDVALLAAAQ